LLDRDFLTWCGFCNRYWFIPQQLDGFPTVVNTTITMDTTVELSGLSGDSVYQINVNYTVLHHQ